MVSTKIKLAVIAAMAFAFVAASMTSEALARSNTGAVVGGLIAGAAIGAAVSGAINHPKTIYVDEAPRRDWNDGGFSPTPGVRCYPAQHACYNADGAYNPNWTYRVYTR